MFSPCCRAVRQTRCQIHSSSALELGSSCSPFHSRGHLSITAGVVVTERASTQLLSRRADARSDDTQDGSASAVSVERGVPWLAGPVLPLVLLNSVAVLWGTQHSVIKLILDGDCSPGITNFARFLLAAIVFSPWTPGLLKRPPNLPFSASPAVAAAPEGSLLLSETQDPTEGAVAPAASDVELAWAAGLELGIWMFLGFAFQAVGLEYTTASRSAFLLYLNVKLVPFFAFLLLGRSISLSTWGSAFLAFGGTVLLSSDGSPPNVGDLWSVASAATSAMFILRLEKYAGSVTPTLLNSANLWVTAGLCGVWAGYDVMSGRIALEAAVAALQQQAPLIAYLALVTTALTNWLQAIGQRSVPAERAAIIYAMDPVYSAAFAAAILGERLGPQGFVGAGLVTLAAIWNQKGLKPPEAVNNPQE